MTAMPEKLSWAKSLSLENASWRTSHFLLIYLPTIALEASSRAVVGRFLWRMCIFGAAIKVETDLRNEMFSHAKDLSRQFYQENKVGGLMSLFIQQDPALIHAVDDHLVEIGD